MTEVPQSPATPPAGAPVSQAIRDGGAIEPVREILWGTSAGARKYETAEELPD
jgi:hypothetical protein